MQSSLTSDFGPCRLFGILLVFESYSRGQGPAGIWCCVFVFVAVDVASNALRGSERLGAERLSRSMTVWPFTLLCGVAYFGYHKFAPWRMARFTLKDRRE